MTVVHAIKTARYAAIPHICEMKIEIKPEIFHEIKILQT